MTTENQESKSPESNPPARDWRAEAAERDAGIDALLKRLGITMTAEFVPFSRAEKWETEKGKKPQETITHRCRIAMAQTGKGARPGADIELWAGEYHQGIGHLPAPYDHVRVRTLDIDCAIKNLIEHGKTTGNGYPQCPRAKIAPPDLRDVFHSILSDASAIDYPTYEEWASDLGYGEDSRKGESIYRRCVEIGLRLRAVLGESTLTELREAFQDY